MIISRNNKPKFKLQTAYDTLTSRLRGLGYDVDGNIELDTSGYGHGWIKVLRNGRKNNFIYMCSHSDNVDPLCCEPVYRYIKVYNYCDDPKDSNLLGEIPYVVSNISEIPDATEVYKDDEYKVYKNNASDIVWGYMNLDEGYAAQAPWTSYPTTLKDLSGSDLNNSVPVFDIIDNKGYRNSDGTVSAFDNVFTDDDVLYVGKSKEVKTLYTWNSAISGIVTSESLYDIGYTLCPSCFGTSAINQYHCDNECHYVDNLNIGLTFKDGDTNTVEYTDSKLFHGTNLSLISYKNSSDKGCDYQLSVERIKDNDYKIKYCLHPKMVEAESIRSTLVQNSHGKEYRIHTREIIKTLSETEYTDITDTFTYKDIANITVKFSLPPTSGLSECLDYGEVTVYTDPKTQQPITKPLHNTITHEYLHAYMKDHKDPNGVYENINVHIYNGRKSEILNYMLHSKSKTFEYSPKYTWNYDEIMNFILYKDENLQVIPSRNGVYHLKTNYYNELKNNSEITELENVLDGNTCMHVGYLGDNAMHTKYIVERDNTNSDISYLQAYNYIKDPFETRYNYFPNNDVYNVQYWKTPKPGFFEGIFQYHNDQLDAKPNKYVWLTMRYGDSEQYNTYEGKIDTVEIRKPETDKKWEWQGNFHNFLTQREVKSIYYKESFSAHDDLSACSALYYEENHLAPTLYNEPLLTSPYNNIAWNGVSGYRHICKTCSGIGMINPYHHDNTWTGNDCIPDDYANIQNIGCPTCGRTGVQTRYLYYKYKYIRSLGNYTYSFDDRVANGNQILLDNTLVDDDIKKDLIIYDSSAAPVAYYQAGPWGNEIRYSPSFLGANQMYNYADVELNENEKPKFITKWTDIPGWNKMSSAEQENTKKQWFKRLYRVVNAPDTFVQYYVYKGFDEAKQRDIWSRIFFDKKWIEKQYFENHTLENPNQYHVDEIIVNRGEHNHNHVSENTHDLTDDRGYPYYGSNGRDYHDRRYELDYRKNGVLLQHVCPVCDGEGTIQTAKTDTNGDIIYDITGKPVMIDVPCPTCNGNGYLEDKHREDYNTAKCSTCLESEHPGSIVCPRCLGTGISYEAQEGYTLERIVEYPDQYSSDPSRLKTVLEFHFKREGEDEQIRFLKYVPIKIGSGTQYRPVEITVITAGDPIEEGTDLYEYVKSVNCPNCTPYKDRLEPGYIPCPECGGAFKKDDTYYRIAPGETDAKKVYKYISINAVSIDNISVEMDNG